MDNIILSGMVNEFSRKQGLQDEKPTVRFEKFANYCLLKIDYYDSFEFEKVATQDCLGIDGLAITIGGVIIDDVEEAESLTKANFEAKFIFSQVKTSPNFNLGDFLKFTTTIRNFFGNDVELVPQQLHNFYKIKELIYDRAAKMSRLPILEYAYLFTGELTTSDANVKNVVECEYQSLQEIKYNFSQVISKILGGDDVAKLYRETQNAIQRQISFQRHVVLPAIRGTNSAYIGVVKCKDFVDIIKKDSGELNKSLFFENVRDFLGAKNPVNQDIQKTILSGEENDRFAILNNGITIIAKKVTPSGDRFTLSRFQVVNGCQTSHVLFNNYSALTDDMFVTVKLIETEDIDLSGKVIATTNSQTVVTKEAFATIRPYHRNLEDFFAAMRSSGYVYYYERRPHQYDDQDHIYQNNIISAPTLIKSFVSLLLEEPHKVHYYYGTLLSEYNRGEAPEIFNENDYPGIYFAAHHIVSMTRNSMAIERRSQAWLFHVALLIKLLVAPDLKTRREITDKHFLEVLANIQTNFEAAYKIATTTLDQLHLDDNQNRLPEATRTILEAFWRANNKAGKQARPTLPTPQNNLSLTNGIYIGTVDKVLEGHECTVKYGPFSLGAKYGEQAADKIRAGRRVSFTIKDNQATIW